MRAPSLPLDRITLGSAREYSTARSPARVLAGLLIMAQASLARFVVPNSAAFTVKPGMVKKFEDLVYTDCIASELDHAQKYLAGPAAIDNHMQPMGVTTAKKLCKDIYEQYQKAEPPVSMSFSGTIWMLDLTHRLIDIDKLDLARMRWALDLVEASRSLHKVMDGFPVAAESIPNAAEFSGLRKIERDADLDAIVLVVYWNRPDDQTTKHPWHDHLRDLHFKAQRAGEGAAASVERFVRYDEEDKKRKVMGLSTFRRAAELKVLVKSAEPQREPNECDAALAARTLASKEELKATWKEDTCRRYLTIMEKFDARSTKIMSKWEMKFARSCLLDSFENMRNAATAAQTEEQMYILVQTLFWEQSCKMRGALEGRTKVGGGGNATALFRAILLRHLFYQYTRQIFPKLDDILTCYGTWRWYHGMYGMDEHGRINNTDPSDSEDDTKKNEDEPGPQTRFESKRKLKLFMDQVAKGKHDTAFVSMARAKSSSMTLDLGCDGMAGIQKTINELYSLYKVEFPEQQAQAVSLPSAEIDVNAGAGSAGVYTPAHVKASSRIESQEEYQAKLAAYQESCRRAQEDATKEHINLRIVMVISDLDPLKINKKLEKVSFMKEVGRKLFHYDSLCQDPLNWAKVRRLKRSFLTGAKVAMTCTQAGQAGTDTLAVLKDVYLAYRSTRDPDGLSEDVVAAIVPGVVQDKPTNEYLDAAWKSLKALGNKHVGPKIGQIVQNKQSLLQHVYTRGIWSRTPDHNMVFTYQTLPRNSTGRKRMKYLSEPGGMFGDTAFNSWPVPMVVLANMPKSTQKEHDDIFENDAADDSGAEDGAGSAVVEDLGDKVIPFPRELSEQLTREMIHVFEIDVGVFLTPGSGKALMAVILENRRAVAIVKNKAQKEFIMQQLTESVKTHNLVRDNRPPKPQELTEWESGHRLPVPKASGAAPPAPAVPGATPAALPAPPAPAPAKAPAPAPVPSKAGAPSLPAPILLGAGAAPPGSGAAPPGAGAAPPAPAPPPAPATSGLAGFGAALLR